MAERLERSERCPACGGSPPDLVDFGLFAVEEGVAIGEAVRCGQGRFIVDRHGGGHVALVAVLVEKSLRGPSTVPMAWELQLASW